MNWPIFAGIAIALNTTFALNVLWLLRAIRNQLQESSARAEQQNVTINVSEMTPDVALILARLVRPGA